MFRSKYKGVCSLLLLAPVSALRAQESLTTASIAGRVTDVSGAVVSGAQVISTQLATNQSQTVRTDSQGRFRLPFLPVGQYAVAAVAPGFSEARRQVQLTVGSAFDLSFTLAVGSTATSVNVQGDAVIVEQNRSQTTQTISENEAANLPLSGRNYLDLALLVPGVSPTNTASVQTFAETSPVLGQGYSVNSQRNFSNGFIVDGLSANDDAAGLAGNVYGLDVVREFQVVTSGGQAEFGRALGGYFNIITKSGTNQVHGNLYGFLRNQRLNAKNALSRGNLPLTQGQYGGSLSGPLQRDRTFAYANFEQRRLNTDGIITITPANATAINARLQAVGYRAPLLAVGTGATTLYPTTVHTTNGFGRVDHQFSSHDQFNLRYSTYRLDSINARGVGSLAAVSNGTAVRDVNHTVAASNIATFSSHTFNETRGQFTYDSLNAPPNDEVGPVVNISGVASFGRFSSSPTARLNYLYEAVNNLVVQRGAHTFKTGVDFLYNRDTITFPQSLRGAYTFASLSAFLAGTYNAQGYTQSFGTPAVAQNNPNAGFYVQDEWKVTPRFTLNLGARYDLQFLRTIHTDTNNVSPRVGFAWSPHPDGRTVVRGSYGLFYDRVPLRALANALLSANNTTDATQAALLSYTFSPGQAGAPTFPNVAAAPPVGALLNYTLMNRHLENAYAQQASLEVEQQLSSRSSVTVSYQHVRGLHLLASINSNINPDGSRPNPTYANSRVYDSKADSYYDGLAVSVVQRPASWASARLSYTWSKAIDDVGEFFFSAPVNNFFVGEDRSRSDDDQRHRAVFDATIFSSTRPAPSIAGHLTHGWRLGGILQYYSRLPFNVVTGTTTRQGTTQRPCAPSFSLGANGGNNPCTQALPGALIGRNAGTGFDFFSLNARLSRTFALTEQLRLESIAEAFNTLNHRNDMVPNGTFGTGAYPSAPGATFGQATAVGDPRSIQFALRMSF
ncbi:MAG: TonB-dependent receptor [Janthinobacterium lividum]